MSSSIWVQEQTDAWGAPFSKHLLSRWLWGESLRLSGLFSESAKHSVREQGRQEWGAPYLRGKCQLLFRTDWIRAGHPGGGIQQEPANKDLALRENTNWYLYSEQKESHWRGADGSLWVPDLQLITYLLSDNSWHLHICCLACFFTEIFSQKFM